MTTATGVRKAPTGPGSSRAPNARIGPWQVGRVIGEGRWTTVYEARSGHAARDAPWDYAAKILKPEHKSDPVAIRLMQCEAYVGRRVAHPNLVSILAVHVDHPPYYVILPRLRGVKLRGALERAGRLSTPSALWIARQTAAALAELHGEGWLHCDVKPDNIFVAANGHATLCDLGLARRIALSSPCGDVLAASPAYAAPEAFGRAVPMGPQSDVYGLAVTLYEMLTGARPFLEDDEAGLAAAHLAEPPRDPRSIVPQLPAGVSRLLKRMLAKDPLRRPSVEELIERLVDLEIDTFDERSLACTASGIGAS